ncbi:MAG: (2Fe-2S) ferredoxin domain-containing protein [Phycisphaerales bacterium]|nr:(2Fe-2S) ferredoxin domain-containing protein [Phycisphaerales bacterium]
MKQPTYHILVCNSFRLNSDPQGVCNRKGAIDLLAALEEQITDRGLDAAISSTGCLKVCDRGPVMVIYPQNWWYGRVDEDAIETILDALEEGQCVEEMLIT